MLLESRADALDDEFRLHGDDRRHFEDVPAQSKSEKLTRYKSSPCGNFRAVRDIVGRCTASAIASPPRKSFFCPFG